MKKSSDRRALRDIGNLVGSLSAKGAVSKQTTGAEQFAATLAKNQHLPQIGHAAEEGREEHVQWGAKQRRKIVSKTKKPNHNGTIPYSIISWQEVIDESSEVEAVEAENLRPNIDQDPVPYRVPNNDPVPIIHRVPNIDPMPTIDEDPVPNIDRVANIDPVPNIDEGDEGNPLAVAEYIQDMSRFYRETEVLSCVPPDYLSRQTGIDHSMRAVVVDWIIKVHWKYGLMPETLFLAINLMDRYLSSQRDLTQRIMLQLVGITAMLVASKYEDIDAPCVQEFMNISNPLYTRNDVLQMEISMLRTLQFNISVPTPYVFLNRFLKAAQADKHLEMVSFFLVELCLVEYDMLKYPPSMLAAAAVYTGKRTLRRLPTWNRTIESYTTYTEDQLQECAKLMVRFHLNSGNGMLIAVHKKYSTEEFSGVAELEPALFNGQRCS